MKYLLVTIVCMVALMLPSLSQAEEELEQRTVTKVYFGFDKTEISGEAALKLADAVKQTNDGHTIILLVGSTDKIGKRLYNLELSKRRADAVRVYLAGMGVSNASIISLGEGEENPLAPADMVPGHLAENRRVDVLSIQPKTKVVKALYRNRLIFFGGAGPQGLNKTIVNPVKVDVNQSFNTIGGLGYSRLLTDRFSVGAAAFSNMSFFLNVGLDF